MIGCLWQEPQMFPGVISFVNQFVIICYQTVNGDCRYLVAIFDMLLTHAKQAPRVAAGWPVVTRQIKVYSWTDTLVTSHPQSMALLIKVDNSPAGPTFSNLNMKSGLRDVFSVYVIKSMNIKLYTCGIVYLQTSAKFVMQIPSTQQLADKFP